MAEIVVKAGQTMWDVAVQEYGAWEAGIDLALVAGYSMTADPPAALPRTPRTYDRVMEAHCKARAVSPATGIDESGIRFRVFEDVFVPIFE